MTYGLSNSGNSVTFSDHQGHSNTASLFECVFSCRCEADDKISTDIARRLVLLDS